MRLCIISFTENGKRLSETIAAKLPELEKELFTKCKALMGTAWDDAIPVQPVRESVGTWAGEQMQKKCALLFIGACGIAVRAVAPHLTDKLHDGPVLVMDEDGRYVIPILSGHMGGANELALFLADKTGAEAVITTATDRSGKFAVDLFAKRNGLAVVNKEGIARVSAKVLQGETVTVAIEPQYEESLVWEYNEGVSSVLYPPEQPVDILITSAAVSENKEREAALILRPEENGKKVPPILQLEENRKKPVPVSKPEAARQYVIGFGCKKGKQEEAIAAFITGKLQELHIPIAQIAAVASVSRKKEEQGILAWCRTTGIPFLTYTVEELQAVEGDFGKSAFVEKQIGVDNVCERAAVKACEVNGGRAELVCRKFAGNGMTIAVAGRSVYKD